MDEGRFSYTPYFVFIKAAQSTHTIRTENTQSMTAHRRVARLFLSAHISFIKRILFLIFF